MASFAEIPTRGELTKDNPYLAYGFYNLSNGKMTIEFLLSPPLNFQNMGGLRFAYSIDDGEPKIFNILEDTKDDWELL